jgi:hypothetical protein
VDDEVRKRLKLFSGVRVTRSLVSRVIFVNRCFLLFLSLDDCVVFYLRILITALVSANLSYMVSLEKLGVS